MAHRLVGAPGTSTDGCAEYLTASPGRQTGAGVPPAAESRRMVARFPNAAASERAGDGSRTDYACDLPACGVVVGYAIVVGYAFGLRAHRHIASFLMTGTGDWHEHPHRVRVRGDSAC